MAPRSKSFCAQPQQHDHQMKPLLHHYSHFLIIPTPPNNNGENGDCCVHVHTYVYPLNDLRYPRLYFCSFTCGGGWWCCWFAKSTSTQSHHHYTTLHFTLHPSIYVLIYVPSLCWRQSDGIFVVFCLSSHESYMLATLNSHFHFLICIRLSIHSHDGGLPSGGMHTHSQFMQMHSNKYSQGKEKNPFTYQWCKRLGHLFKCYKSLNHWQVPWWVCEWLSGWALCAFVIQFICACVRWQRFRRRQLPRDVQAWTGLFGREHG